MCLYAFVVYLKRPTGPRTSKKLPTSNVCRWELILPNSYVFTRRSKCPFWSGLEVGVYALMTGFPSTSALTVTWRPIGRPNPLSFGIWNRISLVLWDVTVTWSTRKFLKLAALSTLSSADDGVTRDAFCSLWSPMDMSVLLSTCLELRMNRKMHRRPRPTVTMAVTTTGSEKL